MVNGFLSGPLVIGDERGGQEARLSGFSVGNVGRRPTVDCCSKATAVMLVACCRMSGGRLRLLTRAQPPLQPRGQGGSVQLADGAGSRQQAGLLTAVALLQQPTVACGSPQRDLPTIDSGEPQAVPWQCLGRHAGRQSESHSILPQHHNKKFLTMAFITLSLRADPRDHVPASKNFTHLPPQPPRRMRGEC